MSAAQEEDVDVGEILCRLDEGELTIPRTAKAVQRWRELHEHLERLGAFGDDLAALVDAMIPEGDDELSLVRLAALSALGEAETANDLVEGLRHGVSQHETPLEAEEVRVMSLHASKGLTADLVVIAGAVEGVFPRVDGRGSLEARQQRAQEQRRLAFVGLTRTTSVLVLSSYSRLDEATAFRLQAKRGSRYGRGFRVYASSFLGEMGPELPGAIRGEDWSY